MKGKLKMTKIKNNLLLFFYLAVMTLSIVWVAVRVVTNNGIPEPRIVPFGVAFFGVIFELALRVKKVKFFRNFLMWGVRVISIIYMVGYVLTVFDPFGGMSHTPQYIEVAELYVLLVFFISSLGAQYSGRSFAVQTVKILAYALCFIFAAFTYKSVVPAIISIVIMVIAYIMFVSFTNKTFGGSTGSTASSTSSGNGSQKRPFGCVGCMNFHNYGAQYYGSRGENYCKYYCAGDMDDGINAAEFKDRIRHDLLSCDGYVPKND